MQATITKLVTPTTTTIKRAAPKRASKRMPAQAYAAVATGAVAVVLVILSLHHLATGIMLVTGAPTWEAIALAIGIDCFFIALECVNLSADDRVRKQIGRILKISIIGTLAFSAILNALAFSHHAPDAMRYYAAVLGLSIPAFIYVATYITARIVITQRKAA